MWFNKNGESNLKLWLGGCFSFSSLVPGNSYPLIQGRVGRGRGLHFPSGACYFPLNRWVICKQKLMIKINSYHLKKMLWACPRSYESRSVSHLWSAAEGRAQFLTGRSPANWCFSAHRRTFLLQKLRIFRKHGNLLQYSLLINESTWWERCCLQRFRCIN